VREVAMHISVSPTTEGILPYHPLITYGCVCRDVAQTYSLEGTLIRKSRGRFQGAFTMDDPNSARSIDDGDANAGNIKQYDVWFVARYFPYQNYSESRPRKLANYDPTRVIDDDEDELDERLLQKRIESEPCVSVRWMGRRLPRANYRNLFFFPLMNKRRKAVSFQKWKQR